MAGRLAAAVPGGVHRERGPIQYRAEVLSTRREGAYQAITLSGPGLFERFRPGHFAAVAIGDESSAHLLRRAFSIARVDRKGAGGGTMELVIADAGPGTHWLVNRRRGDVLDVIAPLGRPFALPKHSVATVLVGGGYGAAPLFGLAERLRAGGSRVDIILGAATKDRLYGTLAARRIASEVQITTEDGSAGHRGRVTDVLREVMDRSDADVVYSCGPMGMLAAVTAIAAERGAHSQTAVEEAMACGVGVCMTCVLPVEDADGLARMVRSCTAGPVFDGHRVRWSQVGTVPPDALGAPQTQAEATEPVSDLPRSGR